MGKVSQEIATKGLRRLQSTALVVLLHDVDETKS
jgi:hypothetical protein